MPRIPTPPNFNLEEVLGHPRKVRGQPRVVKNSAINKKAIGVIYTIALLGSDAKGKQFYFNDVVELMVAYLVEDPNRFNDFLRWAFKITLPQKEEGTNETNTANPDTPQRR